MNPADYSRTLWGCLLVRCVLVLTGFCVGLHFRNTSTGTVTSVADVVFQNDGLRYLSVATTGYDYTPYFQSSVAFFPLYPVLARGLSVFGLSVSGSLWLLSSCCSIAGMWLFAKYVWTRMPHLSRSAIVGFAIYPQSFFFLMAYTESLFFLLAVLYLYAVTVRAHPCVTAAICGLATMTRPVGVALVPAQVIYSWRYEEPMGLRLKHLLTTIPISLSGLLAFMTYLYFRFGDSTAFATVQQSWRVRPPITVWRKLTLLISGEPIWSPYLGSADASWRTWDGGVTWWQSYAFFNPLFFLLAVILIGYGIRRRILSIYEIVVATGLLAIPYFTRAYEMSMGSQGRFTLVVVPVYLSLAAWLNRRSLIVQQVVVAILATTLLMFSIYVGAGLNVF